MRRTPVALSLLVLALVLAVPAGAQDEPPPPLKASLAACSTGPAEDQRFAVFTGSMPAYPGTVRMAMRFDLFIRTSASSRWLSVKGKGLGRWQRSDPGRAGWVHTTRVERLLQGVEYRATVRFRWYQSDAKRPDRVRRTPVCRQPDQRPNLRVESLTINPGPDASTRRYVVTVVNGGQTAAEAFDVRLTAGASESVRSVAGLPAGERARVEAVAPACPMGERVIARADIRGVVDESDERDNRFIGACDGR